MDYKKMSDERPPREGCIITKIDETSDKEFEWHWSSHFEVWMRRAVNGENISGFMIRQPESIERSFLLWRQRIEE